MTHMFEIEGYMKDLKAAEDVLLEI